MGSGGGCRASREPREARNARILKTQQQGVPGGGRDPANGTSRLGMAGKGPGREESHQSREPERGHRDGRVLSLTVPTCAEYLRGPPHEWLWG